MTPTVGRIVHWQPHGKPEPYAALITAVGYLGTVSLAVLTPTGLIFDRSVEYADEPTPGCWNWPPRA